MALRIMREPGIAAGASSDPCGLGQVGGDDRGVVLSEDLDVVGVLEVVAVGGGLDALVGGGAVAVVGGVGGVGGQGLGEVEGLAAGGGGGLGAAGGRRGCGGRRWRRRCRRPGAG